ncbi:3-dehydroquinate synthase [Abyssibacter sp.]|uniref:3-dehydroquinate synthase n=1 Tax=Abyssibacter sp. TaxID=2320200 RepID=UPI003511987C
MIRTLNVDLGDRSYPIHIGAGALDRLDVGSRRCLIVTNETIAPLYLTRLLQRLPDADVCELPDGESHKTLTTAGAIVDRLADGGFHRDSLVIALGGGVIGEIAGFAAAMYHRCIYFIQIPTTLLAMVDSSVGGKTGVNHRAGKNLLGAFHQPLQVLADLDLLATLPPREYAAGLAEVVKYAALGDLAMLGWLESRVEALRAREPETLAEVVHRCCVAKARIVAADEREQGQRALLNLGHTFGHAIETSSGYGALLHGEAVAIGMVMAADLSQRLGWTAAEDVTRLRTLLDALSLPTTPPPIPADTFVSLMQRDKKVLNDQLRLVLLKPLGRAVISADVPMDLLRATLASAA